MLDADSFMVLGTDLVKDHQVAGFFIKRVIGNGPRLLVLDAEENPLSLLANKALKNRRIHLRCHKRFICCSGKTWPYQRKDIYQSDGSRWLCHKNRFKIRRLP